MERSYRSSHLMILIWSKLVSFHLNWVAVSAPRIDPVRRGCDQSERRRTHCLVRLVPATANWVASQRTHCRLYETRNLKIMSTCIANYAGSALVTLTDWVDLIQLASYITCIGPRIEGPKRTLIASGTWTPPVAVIAERWNSQTDSRQTDTKPLHLYHYGLHITFFSPLDKLAGRAIYLLIF